MSRQDKDNALLHRIADEKPSLNKIKPSPAPAFSFMKATSSSLQKNLSLLSLPTKSPSHLTKSPSLNPGARRSVSSLLSSRNTSSDLHFTLAFSPRQTTRISSVTSSDRNTLSSRDIKPHLRETSNVLSIPTLSPSTCLSSFLPRSPQSRGARNPSAGLLESGQGSPFSASNPFRVNVSPREPSKQHGLVTSRVTTGSKSYSHPAPSSDSSRKPCESPTRLRHSKAVSRQTTDSQAPSHNVFERLYPHKKSSVPATTIPRSISNKQVPRPRQRISSIEDLVAILREKDPNALSPANARCDLYENPQMSSSWLSRQRFNEYELQELKREPLVYYFPDFALRRTTLTTAAHNFGYDDKDGNYLGDVHDHIAYRYEILSLLGKGTFGNVVFARDHKYRQSLVAIKIIKSNSTLNLQAMSELRLLKLLTQRPHPHTLRLFAHFVFRGHVCIVTEALDINLFRMIELTQFSGMSPHVARPFLWQILAGLDHIHCHGIIHCDIKPENIMLSQVASNHIAIKIIDMGLACYHGQGPNTYIQSRFYRAPEVILGAPYDAKIDIWLVACVACELITGMPLFSGRNEAHQFALMLELLGAPDQATISRMQRSMILGDNTHEGGTNTKAPRSERELKSCLLSRLFDKHGKLLTSLLSQLANGDRAGTYPIRIGPKLLAAALDIDETEHSTGAGFLVLLRKMLAWNPRLRCSVQELMSDPYFGDEPVDMAF